MYSAYTIIHFSFMTIDLLLASFDDISFIETLFKH